MKSKIFVILLIITNLALMFMFVSAQKSSPASQKPIPVIRASAFELVDQKGQRRASITVATDGETVFRLMDSKGTIRVKLGASEDGSGLVMLNQSTEVGIHALAKNKGTTVTLINADGKKKIFEP